MFNTHYRAADDHAARYFLCACLIPSFPACFTKYHTLSAAPIMPSAVSRQCESGIPRTLSVYRTSTEAPGSKGLVLTASEKK